MINWQADAYAKSRANPSISAMRPPCYSLSEEKVILGVIYGSLVWGVCNPAAPVWPRGIPGVSPETLTSRLRLDVPKSAPTAAAAASTRTFVCKMARLMVHACMQPSI